MKSKLDTRLREKENIAGAASVAEASRIRTLINRHKRPRGILTWNAEYGEDTAGEPAVWIWFHIRDEDKIPQERVKELTDFVEAVRSKLLDSHLDRWPYVGFRNPPR
jgi:hypothetical protein